MLTCSHFCSPLFYPHLPPLSTEDYRLEFTVRVFEVKLLGLTWGLILHILKHCVNGIIPYESFDSLLLLFFTMLLRLIWVVLVPLTPFPYCIVLQSVHIS